MGSKHSLSAKDRNSTQPLRILDLCGDSYFEDISPGSIDYVHVPLARPLHPHSTRQFSPRWTDALRALLHARLGKFDWVLLPPLHLDFTIGNPWPQRFVKSTVRFISRSKFVTKLAHLLFFFGRCKYAILDPSDSAHSIGKELIRLTSSPIYFKRNLIREDAVSKGGNVDWQPLPMIFSDQWLDGNASNRASKTAVMFSAGDYNSKERQLLLETGKILKDRGLEVDLLEAKVPMDEFYQRVAAAEFCSAAQGVGYHTWRMFEASALGSIPVLNPPPHGLWAWFEDGVNCVFALDDAEETADKIEKLARSSDLNRIKSAAADKINQFHRASIAGIKIIDALKHH